MQVADYVTEQLRLWGVKHIYGVAGDAILPWLDVLGKQKEIRYIACRHESAAAMMATAEAKLTGRPAVCTATGGPGTLNLINGLADAYADQVPVLAITGQVETHKLGSNSKQFVPQEDVLRPISLFTTTVAHPEAIGHVLHKAFVTAGSQRGVAHLAVCKDIFSRSTSWPLVELLPRLHTPVMMDRVEMNHTAELLHRTKRPVVLLGSGCRQQAALCKRLAEELGAAILLTLGAKGVIDEAHPQVVGGLGEGGSIAGLSVLAEADLLFILGASWFPRSFIPAGLQVVQVDHRPVSIHAHPLLFSVTAELGEVLPLWIQRLERKESFFPWRAQVEAWHTSFWQETERIVAQGQDELIKPETLLHALSEVVDEKAVVALDTGEHTLWFNRAFRAKSQFPLFSGKWRTMGYGLPAAIAAKLNGPDKQVVAVVGDGGLQMNLAELMTAVENDLRFPIIVVHNNTLGLEEWKMVQAGLTPFGTRIRNPDFVKWAEACGVKGNRVETVKELLPALTEAVHADELRLLDIQCTLPTLTERKREIPFQAQAPHVYNERKV
ncbi:thiamine pyrophosphate-binding protein [Brevibacillus ruminantium]|uniref:Thiamine pyrophosphate-binding protein n=1 Tax=Brevibacillus ruminantium TaxID=2950604 RepID=A0ABY4WGB6_9BACL|nr:thiamine pyrophosphate-binding protein [Brevibacillus ruminantium]USG63701.1 thiamine pyrophosphate-binding protein [Brevibacillus ruminantium]